MNLQEVKNYLRVDEDIIEDDELIKSLIESAKQYIEFQTGKKYKEFGIWNIAIKILVLHWYDNRTINPNKTGSLSEYPHSISAMINHISLCSDYDNWNLNYD